MAENRMSPTTYLDNFMDVVGLDKYVIRENDVDMPLRYWHYYSDTFEKCVKRMLDMRDEYPQIDLQIVIL